MVYQKQKTQTRYHQRRRPHNLPQKRQLPEIKSHQKLRIIPLGGMEEVGANMIIYEYGDDILIVDMGLQFPDDDMPGIDFIIPNIEYLESKKQNIRGIIVTHGHYDHLGAIPYLIEKIGYPTIYAAPLTRGIILRRQEDFPQLKKLDVEIINENTKLNLGVFNAQFIHINHNIPDAVALAIKTPAGMIIHATDYKFDFTPIADKPADIAKIARLSSEGIVALLADSTGAETPGHSISEKIVKENMENIFRDAKGRIIVATFSSLITRIQQVIDLAEKYGKKVAVDGYSMKSNVEISRELGYLKCKKGTLVKINEIDAYPPNEAVVMCTGAQGEGEAVLMRIANREHRFIRIQKDDSVVFSSSVVPGNERTVQNLKDLLSKQGAKLFHYKMMDIHAGGHAPIEDIKLMINLVKPKFLVPIHGSYYMLKLHADIAESVGIPHENIAIASNGRVIELTPEKIHLSEEKVPSNYIMVDGLGVGDVGQVVLRDRQAMAKDGIFVIIVLIDGQSGKIRTSPDIISRGFIYLRESQELLAETRKKVREIIAKTATADHTTNWAYVKDNLRDKIGQFLYSKTERRPMVIPVVIEI